MTSRRRFIQSSALAAAGVLARRALPHSMARAAAPLVPNLDPNTLARFVDPLPLAVLARPVGRHADPARHGEQVRHYRVAMRAVSSKLHRDLPPTGLWSYGGSVPGVMFDTRSGEALSRGVGQRVAHETFSARSITRCTARKRSHQKFAASCTCMAARRRRKAMAIQRIGMCLASRAPITIPTARMPRCSGITITRWASTGSTSMPDCSACTSFATKWKTICICPVVNTKCRWSCSIAMCAATGNSATLSRPILSVLGCRSSSASCSWSTAKYFPFLRLSRANIAFGFSMPRTAAFTACP